MKTLRTFLATALLALTATAHAESIELEVNGLVCAFCAQGIEKSLRQFPATGDVYVSLEHRLVAIALKEGQDIDEATLRKAITDAGYTTVAVKRTADSLATIRARVHNHPRHR
jgi:copper chaperone CopZ